MPFGPSAARISASIVFLVAAPARSGGSTRHAGR
jgi:hypothetical protein